MRKILITGSEGFVGGHLINILKKEYFLIGLSRQEDLKSEKNVIFEKGDIIDSKRMEEILEKYIPDTIIHLAALAKTWGNTLEEVFKVNFFGTLNIFERILEIKKKSNFNPKILYVSSADVYGKTKNPEKIGEDAPFFPINSYGVSKVAADRLSYQYSQSENLNVVIARPFNHSGPGQRLGFFVPDMASQIVQAEKEEGKKEIYVGNLEAVKDFLDVRDVVEAYRALIETDIRSGEAFNICTGVGVKFSSILDKLLKLAKKRMIVKTDSSRMRKSEIPILIGNNEKIINKTSWKPKYSLDQTLLDTLEYWRHI